MAKVSLKGVGKKNTLAIVSTIKTMKIIFADYDNWLFRKFRSGLRRDAKIYSILITDLNMKNLTLNTLENFQMTRTRNKYS